MSVQLNATDLTIKFKKPLEKKTTLSKARSIFYHLYPGAAITLCFALLAPALINYHVPPQLSLILCIVLVAIPVLLLHLQRVRKVEKTGTIWQVNGFQHRLPTGRLVMYVLALVAFAYLVWGLVQPLDAVVANKFFYWLPDWYKIQDFQGYDKKTIQITLVLNLLFNGLVAPVVEELYFRGYLLSRMTAWGKWAFAANAILFSLYHFWQPYIYLTLILSHLPITYLVWKTKDLRVGIWTHVLLNLIGAFLSFGLLMK
jgi:hypothetical protein